MILVLSGTKEGTEIISLLAARGNKVFAVTATSYGTKMAESLRGVQVIKKSPSIDELKKIYIDKSILLTIDASHPLPSSISNMAREVCTQLGTPYIRFLREETDLPDNPLIKIVHSWKEAAEKAAGFGSTIFLTTGSNNLETILQNELVRGKRVIVRVLPDYKVVQKCQNLGLTPKDIIAMQGPFSREMNRQQFKMYNASVVVTKDSGKAGGTDTKISAALSMGLPVVIIRGRGPKEKFEVTDFEKLLELVKEILVIR